MKSCLLFLCASCLFLSSLALASEVKCYSSGELIYKDKQTTKDVYVGEGFVIVRHGKERSVIVADCIIHYKAKSHHV